MRDPVMISRAVALGAGFSDDELQAARRQGRLTSVRRGAYVGRADFESLDERGRHRLLVRSTWPRLQSGTVVSHESAAVLLGVPLWRCRLGPVTVTRAARARREPTLRVHSAILRPDEIVWVDDVPVTSAVRTAIDLATVLDHEPAVVAADHLLHTQAVSREELLQAQRERAGRRHSRGVRRVVEFADPAAESVGESLSRVALAGLALPPIQTQVEVRERRGRLVARCDFGIPELRVYGEFDGRVKYGRLLKPGQSPGDVVFAEKRREDQVRDTGAEMVRWVWDEIFQPEVLAERWTAAIRRATR